MCHETAPHFVRLLPMQPHPLDAVEPNWTCVPVILRLGVAGHFPNS